MENEVNKVKELGESIGYGHLMNIASALWRKNLQEKGYPTTGAFVPTCLQFVDKEMVEGMEKEHKIYDIEVSKS